MTRGLSIFLKRFRGVDFRPSGFKVFRALTFLGLLSGFAGCLSDSGGSAGGEDAILSDGDYTPEVPTLPPGWPAMIWPADNPYTPAKAILGRRLFFEGNLSRDGSISCTWCHAPGHAFTDKHRTDFSTGVGGFFTTRNSPTVVNLAFFNSFMFDGSASTLEEQATMPLLNPHEMDMTAAEVESRVASDPYYVKLYRQSFGPGPITLGNIARALATYQRTLVSFRSPYDAWMAGDSSALSASARRGAQIFIDGRGGCARCHTPPLFTDGKFHNIGLETDVADSGRYHVTNDPQDIGKFKTPTLRNIYHTGPYMHDGRYVSLEEVVRHYNSEFVTRPGADPLLQPLELNDAQVQDLVAFLESLTDETILHSPQF
jgi:cytochrome c peroxidase